MRVRSEALKRQAGKGEVTNRTHWFNSLSGVSTQNVTVRDTDSRTCGHKPAANRIRVSFSRHKFLRFLKHERNFVTSRAFGDLVTTKRIQFRGRSRINIRKHLFCLPPNALMNVRFLKLRSLRPSNGLGFERFLKLFYLAASKF